MKRPYTLPHQKMQESGYSLKRLADEINTHFDLHITKPDVSNFAHNNLKKISVKKRRIIRLFFIAHRWIKTPKKKNIPVCVHCGTKYPTGKTKRRSLTIRKIQTLIKSSNHKRTLKNSQ